MSHPQTRQCPNENGPLPGRNKDLPAGDQDLGAGKPDLQDRCLGDSKTGHVQPPEAAQQRAGYLATRCGHAASGPEDERRQDSRVAAHSAPTPQDFAGGRSESKRESAQRHRSQDVALLPADFNIYSRNLCRELRRPLAWSKPNLWSPLQHLKRPPAVGSQPETATRYPEYSLEVQGTCKHKCTYIHNYIHKSICTHIYVFL